jgi:hypothetical protein
VNPTEESNRRTTLNHLPPASPSQMPVFGLKPPFPDGLRTHAQAALARAAGRRWGGEGHSSLIRFLQPLKLPLISATCHLIGASALPQDNARRRSSRSARRGSWSRCRSIRQYIKAMAAVQGGLLVVLRQRPPAPREGPSFIHPMRPVPALPATPFTDEETLAGFR